MVGLISFYQESNRSLSHAVFIDHDQVAVTARVWDFVVPIRVNPDSLLKMRMETQSSVALSYRIVRAGLAGTSGRLANVTIASRIREFIAPRTATFQKNMKEERDDAHSSLSETMAARIEIKELRDPARESEITDAILALDGVIETRIQKGALHISYDPLTTTEKKIEQAVRSTGNTVKTAATDTETAHPELSTSAHVEHAPVENAHDDEHS
jgi:copper chaperone CopZ